VLVAPALFLFCAINIEENESQRQASVDSFLFILIFFRKKGRRLAFVGVLYSISEDNSKESACGSGEIRYT